MTAQDYKLVHDAGIEGIGWLAKNQFVEWVKETRIWRVCYFYHDHR